MHTALHDSGLDPATPTLEIAETVLMRKPDATAYLRSQIRSERLVPVTYTVRSG
ncbi:MAG TPA: hypothetical protein VNY27_08240 [Solirubrobacteraceae bacterium]|nr:hypothetical protein [Solirubrobacteraceae bacterium]